MPPCLRPVWMAAAVAGEKDSGRTVVNGVPLNPGGTILLGHNDRLIIGNNNVLRVSCLSKKAESKVQDDEVDWQFAMKEVNAEIMSAMQNSEVRPHLPPSSEP